MDWSLARLEGFLGAAGPVVIVVLDGVGIGAGDEADAVKLARTPTLDRLWVPGARAAIAAHGTAVGLPTDDDMGNSEVGHNAIGAGRVYDQGAKLVNGAIASGKLFDGEAWTQIVERCVNAGSALHFIGLHSDGNVHSHTDQLYSMLRKAAEQGVKKLFVHVLTDGRDVHEGSAVAVHRCHREGARRARQRRRDRGHCIGWWAGCW